MHAFKNDEKRKQKFHHIFSFPETQTFSGSSLAQKTKNQAHWMVKF